MKITKFQKILAALLFVSIVSAVSYVAYRGDSVDYQVIAGECQKPGISKKQCWDTLTRTTVKKYGIDRTFELIAYIYAHDPEFANPCHSMTHIIGQAAYQQFRSQKSVPLSDKTAYCSFGFYHGFMETLIARKGTIAEARAFCTYIDDALGSSIPNAKLGCYHGIGHGSTDVHNPKYFGNERALIQPAIANCEAFSENAEQLKLCVTGVFDSISIAYYNPGTNGLVMKKDDPLWLCHEQQVKYKESCYLDMMPAVFWLAQHDLKTALDIVARHVEPAYLQIATQTVAEDSVRFVIGVGTPKDGIAVCRTLANDLSASCINGLSSGMMQFGTPGREYVQALKFCADSGFAATERDGCYATVLGYASHRYSEKIVREICTGIQPAYQKYCQK